MTDDPAHPNAVPADNDATMIMRGGWCWVRCLREGKARGGERYRNEFAYVVAIRHPPNNMTFESMKLDVFWGEAKLKHPLRLPNAKAKLVLPSDKLHVILATDVQAVVEDVEDPVGWVQTTDDAGKQYCLSLTHAILRREIRPVNMPGRLLEHDGLSLLQAMDESVGEETTTAACGPKAQRGIASPPPFKYLPSRRGIGSESENQTGEN